MSKLLTVFGATGNQGGSVISAVLRDPILSKEFKIRGVTRDVTKKAAKDLSSKGVEMVAADLSNPKSLTAAVEGTHTIFLVTNFWETASKDVETSQGKAATDAAKKARVRHLIFSSLIGATEASGGKFSNFDGKANVERYIRDSGVPATFYLPGMFMSNFFQMIRKEEDGSYILAVPVSPEQAKVPLIDNNADTGRYVASILKNNPTGNGKRVFGAAAYTTFKDMLDEFSEIMGKPARALQIDGETFKSFLPQNIAQEFLENFQLLEGPGYYNGASLAESETLLDGKPTTWKEFVAANMETWL